MSVSRLPHKTSVLARLAHNYHSEVFTAPFSPLNEGLTSALALQMKESVLLNALSLKVPLAGDNWIGTFTLDVQWHSQSMDSGRLSDSLQSLYGGSKRVTSMQSLKSTLKELQISFPLDA